MPQPQRTGPTPEMILAARQDAGLTQHEAAELINLGHAQRWSDYEGGRRAMDFTKWELFSIKVGMHPKYGLLKAPKKD